MSAKLDPKEVLQYLNELGYCNITALQLKEFIRDLKALMKYDQRKAEKKENKENKENIPETKKCQACPLCSCKRDQSNLNTVTQGIQTSIPNVPVSFYPTPQSIQTNFPKCTCGTTPINFQPASECVQTNVSKCTCGTMARNYYPTSESVQTNVLASLNKTAQTNFNHLSKPIQSVRKKCTCGTDIETGANCRMHLITNMNSNKKTTDRGQSVINVKKPTRRLISDPLITDIVSSFDNRNLPSACTISTNTDVFLNDTDSVYITPSSGVVLKPFKNKTTSSGTELRPKASFIRPQRPVQTAKCDPVALYHQYQAAWKKQKLPGEDKHSDLRWAIRERMLGGPNIIPVSTRAVRTSAPKRTRL